MVLRLYTQQSQNARHGCINVKPRHPHTFSSLFTARSRDCNRSNILPSMKIRSLPHHDQNVD
ncbi:unnamed protein product [Periconia digitata]|uniref:Uncharacterized protein n=1 Tax=Periconia digitata TaxID=1303443 RepID=A0A9W4XQM8_9PLEO|nr:unnamed protein product [Periconia digitata]